MRHIVQADTGSFPLGCILLSVLGIGGDSTPPMRVQQEVNCEGECLVYICIYTPHCDLLSVSVYGWIMSL